MRKKLIVVQPACSTSFVLRLEEANHSPVTQGENEFSIASVRFLVGQYQTVNDHGAYRPINNFIVLGLGFLALTKTVSV